MPRACRSSTSSATATCPARDLGQAPGLSQPALSRHLALLRGCGLVVPQRQGQHIVYQPVSPKVVAICDAMREVLAEQAAHQAELARALDQPPSQTRPAEG
jgi:DNA-binding transcriptional ArsR family regulator